MTTIASVAQDYAETRDRRNRLHREAVAYAIAVAGRLEQPGSIIVPGELYDAVAAWPGSVVRHCEGGLIAELRIGHASITACRLLLQEGA